MSIKNVITIGVSLLVIALILPLGLGLLGLASDTIIVVYNATGLNESAITLADAIDPSVLTLLTVLVPILAVIGIAIGFIYTRD
ncbi:MAG: hypothetical protein E3J52_02420 [Promethearchaeota archaeon]|nr:MAG: hypothetical protein E3J52_02420 [Candidatus Lokiarchaeota archaeon]